jgi:hypothetical protein
LCQSIGRFLDIEAGVDDDEFNNSDMEEDEEGLEGASLFQFLYDY